MTTTTDDLTFTRYNFLSGALPQPPMLLRMDGGDTRFYATCDPDGNVTWYPSVTSVIRETSPTSPYLIDWIAKHGREQANRLRDEAAAYGTAFHILSAAYLQGARINIDAVTSEHGDRMGKDLASWDAFVTERDVQPIAIEITLHSDTLLVAGTADLICTMNFDGQRIVALIDNKTGKNTYRDHAVQLEFYRQMWAEHYGETYPVTHIFTWQPKEWRSAKPTYTLTNHTGAVEAIEPLYRARLWSSATDKRTPSVRTKVSGDLSRYETDSIRIATVDPSDAIRERWLSIINGTA